jgi:signal transduction histidine kinase
MKGKLEFQPAARLQYILSEELVADPNVAVLEFVKNAYDADATEVLIEFDLDPDRLASRLTIADNGKGMDFDEFEANWMHPGFSEKVGAGPTSKKRVPVGEKGLGRMAAGRLGYELDVYTRRRKRDKWLHAHIRWADFDDMRKRIEDVKIAWDDESKPDIEGVDRGTVIEISGLKMRWDARVPGRRAKGRANTRLGRLRQDLEVLLLPLTAAGQDFAIDLQHNSELPDDIVGYINPAPMRLLDYQYDFEVYKTPGGRWRIQRTIRRSPTEAKRLDVKEVEKSTISPDDLPQAVDLDACGPFSGSFFYAPRSARQLRALGAPVGVRIYRDSVRIDPYGDPEDDWLGASERKAVRQGHAAIQPNSLYGAVKVSKRDNPHLRPLANREGFVANDALTAFLAVARQQFDDFGEIIQREYIDPNWRVHQQDETARKALDATQWAVAITRSAAHAVRQPITGADTDLSRLQRTIRRAELPDDVRAQLQELHDRTRDHLHRIDEAVDKMLGYLDISPEPVEVDVSEMVSQMLKKVKPAARSAGVSLQDGTDEEITAIVPRGLVEHALEELLQNAIRAPRPPGRLPAVRVEAHHQNGSIHVAVVDNGGGIPPEIDELLFKQTVSSSGHIGVGLMWNRRLLQIASGDLERVYTGPTGTRFDVILPPAQDEVGD